MKRPRLLLAATLPIAMVLGACGPTPRPVSFYLDSHFDDAEVASIQWSMDQWNREVGKHLNVYQDTFRIAGRTDDSFDIGDLTDGKYVIYKITDPTRPLRIVGATDALGKIGGHSTTDMEIMRFNFPDVEGESWDYLLKVIALHELGHTVGLLHYTHRFGIMNPVVGKEMYQDPHITDADMEEYCIVNECDK